MDCSGDPIEGETGQEHGLASHGDTYPRPTDATAAGVIISVTGTTDKVCWEADRCGAMEVVGHRQGGQPAALRR
jgi:hypothetical protein